MIYDNYGTIREISLGPPSLSTKNHNLCQDMASDVQEQEVDHVQY